MPKTHGIHSVVIAKNPNNWQGLMQAQVHDRPATLFGQKSTDGQIARSLANSCGFCNGSDQYLKAAEDAQRNLNRVIPNWQNQALASIRNGHVRREAVGSKKHEITPIGIAAQWPIPVERQNQHCQQHLKFPERLQVRWTR